MDTMTVSSKGQICIPEKARRQMNISYGDKVAYIVFDDTMVIKRVKMPSEEEFEESLKRAQQWAASVGMTENDINDAIKAVRKRNHGK